MNVASDAKAFEVGKEFEDYLEKVIFNKTNFILVDKTHPYSQNSERYVESSKKPDFKFRCKKTKQEFYVEAKFRSHYNADDKVQIIKPDQYIRYHEYNKIESPVFIAVGIGGKPSKPNSISLIPLTEIHYLDLYKSVLDKYIIKNDKAYDSKDLKLHVERAFPQQKVYPNQTNNEIKSKSIWKNNFVRLAVLGVIFYFVVALRFQSQKLSTNGEQKLRNKQELLLGGCWFIPHDATTNIKFNRDFTFNFIDFNGEHLKGTYTLNGTELLLMYADRPKQRFYFYKATAPDKNYYIKGYPLKTTSYYFVHGECPPLPLSK